MLNGILGLAVWTHILLFSWRVERGHSSFKPLVPSDARLPRRRLCKLFLVSLAMLYLLPFDGIPRPVTFYQALVRTGHQTNGALLLAATIVATLRTFSSLARPVTTRSSECGKRVRTGRSSHAKMDWESGCLKSMVSVDQPLLAPASDDILAVWATLPGVSPPMCHSPRRLVLLVLVTVAVGFLLESAAIS